MAKITGPLGSETAWGSIGKEHTFSRRKSGMQVRFQRKQKDVSTTKRTNQRLKFSLGLELWSSLPDNEKNYWKTCAQQGYVNV